MTVYATSRVHRYSRGGLSARESELELASGALVPPLSRTAIRSPIAGQYRAETTAMATNATMKISPPLKPNTNPE